MCRVCVRDTVSIYVHPVVYGFILICVFVECQYSIEMKCVCVCCMSITVSAVLHFFYLFKYSNLIMFVVVFIFHLLTLKYNLPPTKEEVNVFARVCLSVCLSVSKIIQKRVHGFGCNVACQLMSGHGRTD